MCGLTARRQFRRRGRCWYAGPQHLRRWARMPDDRSRVERVRGNLRKFAFESLYGPFAWAYDWVSRTFFMGQWRLWQRASIRHLSGKRVLELGMGTGNLQIDLRAARFEPYGVDLSPQML